MEVGDLFELESGTTSTLQGGCQLKGILSIISNENDPHLYQRGTIILQDPQDVRYSIECIVDRYLPNLTDKLIYINHWTYIYDKERESRCIEFFMDSVIVTLSQQQSVLRDKITEDNTTMEWILAQQQRPIRTPLHDKTSPIDGEDVCIAGRVQAVSALYIFQGSSEKTTFFVQLTSDIEEEQEHKIIITFKGDDTIKYHRFFNIGLYYAFRHVQPSVVATQQQEQDQTLTYTFESSIYSICFIISSSFYRNLIIPPPGISIDDSIQYQSAQLIANRTSPEYIAPPQKKYTITGTITRLVDEVFQIYEVDDQYLLSLFHYMGHPLKNHPYRYGTKVRISHFHFAHILTKSQEDDDNHNSNNSILLEQLWKTKNQQVIVTCAKTRIEIISLPIDNCDTPPYVEKDSRLKGHLAMYIHRQHASFSQLIRQLEMYAVLKYEFPDLTDDIIYQTLQSLRNHLFDKTKKRHSRGRGYYINDFIHHNKVCSAIGSDIIKKDVFSVKLEVCLNLAKVKSELIDKLRPYKMDLAGANRAFDKGNTDVKMAPLNTLSTNYYIIGVVEFKDDGRLYLIGGKSSQGSRILLQTNRQHLRLGSIYIVQRGQLFQEDLSFMKQDEEEDGKKETKYTLDITYLSCDAQDLIPTRHSSDFDLQFHMNLDFPRERLNESIGFTFDDQGYKLLEPYEMHMIIYVLDVYSTYLKPYRNESKELTMSLECRMMVLVYQLKHQQEREFNRPIKCQLIMDSKRQGLKFNKEFQIGQWYALLKLDTPNTEPGNNNSIFYLDGSKQVVCPIHFNMNKFNKETVVISPRTSSEQQTMDVQFDPQDALIQTYAVKQFVNKDLLPDERLNEKSAEWFYKHTFNVRGVVIVKRFIDGYSNHGLYDKHALPLFQTLGIGSGKHNRKLVIQLRQEDSLDIINIYAKIDQVHYPLGLVCGATVTFRNLIRKTVRGSDVKFQCNTDGITTIHVESTFPTPRSQVLEIGHVGTKYLASFRNEQGALQEETKDTMFKICCQVTSIIALQLKLECKDCGSVVRDNECHGMCKFASRLLSASAFIQIDDGTALANANVDGERLVFRLLQLGNHQEEWLKKLVVKYGEINYGDRNKDVTSMHGFSLEGICSSAKQAGHIWIYGELQRQVKKRKRQMFEDQVMEEARYYQDGTPMVDIEQRYGLRAFNLSDKSNLMPTMAMLNFKIKVMEIESVDHSLSAYKTLLQIEQSMQDVEMD